jgi:hypothetical protein
MNKYSGWEPTEGGIFIAFGPDEDAPGVTVATSDLVELRDDLTEAILDPKGYQAVDTVVSDILPHDLIYVLGNHYEVMDTMLGHKFRDEEEWLIQFSNGAFTQVTTEVQLPGDQQVTVYRRAERAEDEL